MDILQQLGTALGIGLLSGIRLYLTILGLGAAIRFHWVTLDPSQSGWAILADWRVMTVAGIACAIEFVCRQSPLGRQPVGFDPHVHTCQSGQ